MSKKPMKVLGVAAVAALSLAVMAGCTPKDADPAESVEPTTSQSVETQTPDESVVETPDESAVKDPDKALPDETPGKIDGPADADVTDEGPAEEAPAEDASIEAEVPADGDAATKDNAGGEADASIESTPVEGETATDEAATEG